MDRFTALTVFRTVVELGSFARASRHLGLSPAAITKNVGELESYLGVRLLNRTTRQLSRTEAGSRYFDYVCQILNTIDEADRNVGQLQVEPSGVLRVTAPMTLTLLKLSSLLPSFLKLYPKISIELDLCDRRVNLVEEGFDVAIRGTDTSPDPTLVALPLMRLHNIVCASPEYFALAGMPGHPSDLARHNCIQFTLSSHVSVWRFEKDSEIAEVAVSGRYRVNSSLSVRAALLQGFGLSLVPEEYVQRELADGSLVRALDDWTSFRTGIFAVYASQKHLSPKVSAFIGFVESAFGAGPGA